MASSAVLLLLATFALAMFPGSTSAMIVTAGGEPLEKLTPDSVKNVSVLPAGSKAARLVTIHFTAGSAPLAATPDGGSLVAYADAKDAKLYVRSLNAAGVSQRVWSVGRTGKPFDILVRSWGFVLMAAENTNNLFVIAINTNGSVRWNITVMNNGDTPAGVTKQQINFDVGKACPAAGCLGDCVSGKCDYPFGWKAMWLPFNGRLTYANGLIFVIFAHFANFGEQDHIGDSMITLDDTTGATKQLVFSWAASHSLAQRILYDGKNVITASLGDAYPQQVLFIRSENASATNAMASRSNENLLDGSMPGNGGGGTLGRIGGMFEMQPGLFVLGFARRPGGTNTQDQMGLLYFNNALQRLATVTLGPGKLVNQMKTAKYGSGILMAHVTVPATTEEYLRGDMLDSDRMTITHLSACGEIKSQFAMPQLSASAADEWVTLADGRVAWTWVDKNGALLYFSVPPPTVPSPLCTLPTAKIPVTTATSSATAAATATTTATASTTTTTSTTVKASTTGTTTTSTTSASTTGTTSTTAKSSTTATTSTTKVSTTGTTSTTAKVSTTATTSTTAGTSVTAATSTTAKVSTTATTSTTAGSSVTAATSTTAKTSTTAATSISGTTSTTAKPSTTAATSATATTTPIPISAAGAFHTQNAFALLLCSMVAALGLVL